MNAADTAWIIIATALVLFMTLPGLALFYGGLVRARNVLSVFMHCDAIAALMSVLWLAVGYSIAFGGDGAVLGRAWQDVPARRHDRHPVRHPARGCLFRLPDDLRHHHPSADRRRLCRTGRISALCWGFRRSGC